MGDELNGDALIGLGADAQHAQPGALVDGGELIMPPGRNAGDRGDGASLRSAPDVPGAASRSASSAECRTCSAGSPTAGRGPAGAGPSTLLMRRPRHRGVARGTSRCVRDRSASSGADARSALGDLALGGDGAVMKLRAAISQPLGTQLVEPVRPLVEHRPADPDLAARRRDVP